MKEGDTMPMIFDGYYIPEKLDRRKKLTSEQKDEIKHKYSTGLYSLNELAKEYKVCKKTVLLIVNPKSKERTKEYQKEYHKTYVDTYENKRIIEHREYKQKLFEAGLLE